MTLLFPKCDRVTFGPAKQNWIIGLGYPGFNNPERRYGKMVITGQPTEYGLAINQQPVVSTRYHKPEEGDTYSFIGTKPLDGYWTMPSWIYGLINNGDHPDISGFCDIYALNAASTNPVAFEIMPHRDVRRYNNYDIPDGLRSFKYFQPWSINDVEVLGLTSNPSPPGLAPAGAVAFWYAAEPRITQTRVEFDGWSIYNQTGAGAQFVQNAFTVELSEELDTTGQYDLLLSWLEAKTNPVEAPNRAQTPPNQFGPRVAFAYYTSLSEVFEGEEFNEESPSSLAHPFHRWGMTYRVYFVNLQSTIVSHAAGDGYLLFQTQDEPETPLQRFGITYDADGETVIPPPPVNLAGFWTPTGCFP